MSLLSVDELKALVEQSQGPCVSIYMPTHVAGPETRQNSIRFKNLIKQAEAQLQEYGATHDEALRLLQPALELDTEDFWQHQDIGFALFVADNFLHYYRVPLNFDELVVTTDRPHLKPLMPLLTGDGNFYILTLSQQQIRLFEATRYSIHEVELEGVPQSLTSALQYDETAKEGQHRISGSRGGGLTGQNHPGSAHGQGSPDRDQHQKDILQFFHLVNDGLQPYLNGQRAPLILVGVEYLLPLYREANSYPFVLDEGITENADILKADELHQQALPIVEPFFAQAQQSAVEHFRELTGTGKTSIDPKEAIPAAFYGRVEQLFVAVGIQQWGVFDPQANELLMHADAEPGDEDLLNAAAIQTLLNGGTVYAVPPEEVPDTAPLAAVFRY